MEKNTCFKTSNNKYFDCPALMSDGRVFTDYRPSNYVNDMIRIQNKVYDSYNYRQFLINNAEKIIAVDNEYNVLKNNCPSCVYDKNAVPTESVCVYNKKYGLCKTDGCNGLGQRNLATPDQSVSFLQPGFQKSEPAPFRPTNNM